MSQISELQRKSEAELKKDALAVLHFDEEDGSLIEIWILSTFDHGKTWHAYIANYHKFTVLSADPPKGSEFDNAVS